MIPPSEIRCIIRGALRPFSINGFSLYSADAEELLMMTQAHESHNGAMLRQVGGGPGCGLCQVELRTMEDNYKNFLNYQNRAKLLRQVERLFGFSFKGKTSAAQEVLTTNHGLNIFHARLWYYRATKSPIPAATDLHGLAAYAKQWFNTPLGAATAQKYYDDYLFFVVGGGGN